MFILNQTTKVKHYLFLMVATCTIIVISSDFILAENTLSKAEAVKFKASNQNKYTFVMFWKKKDNATSTMWKNLSGGLDKKSDQATYTQVRVNDPAEANLVKKYGVSRAPMPLTLAIAPNGAITGSFVKRLNEKNIDKSFVSPAKAQCMHALQSRKLVLLCVNPISLTGTPKGVDEFKSMPCYIKNAKVITLSSTDPEETSFLQELKIPANGQIRNVVFMAPPGVLVGKFKDKVTKEELIASLKKSGQGCGVEGCEHCKE